MSRPGGVADTASTCPGPDASFRAMSTPALSWGLFQVYFPWVGRSAKGKPSVGWEDSGDRERRVAEASQLLGSDGSVRDGGMRAASSEVPRVSRSERLIFPDRHQPKLLRDRFIVEEAPDEEAVPFDVVFVGGGPAGLAGAIELARLVREGNEAGDSVGAIEIGVLEKAEALGNHNLSGAVINPVALRQLFPDIKDGELPLRRPVADEAVYFLHRRGSVRIPTPPTMRNRGNYVASICEVVRWLGARAEELGVTVLPGFPADSLLVDGTDVVGIRTVPRGLDRKGRPLTSGHMPAVDVSARVTVLAEGTRGPLTQAYLSWQRVGSTNPQIYSLGVKELWEVPRPVVRTIHTVGWPLLRSGFGGTFAYPMSDHLVALGLVASLDDDNANLDVHALLQQVKAHPLFSEILKGGELVEWGAKTIPEGGYHSLPHRYHGGGLCIVGDAAGFVDVASLKGIHYAMHSGVLAARAIYRALRSDDVSGEGLAEYSRSVGTSRIARDLRRNRNMRLAFKGGMMLGGIQASLASLTGGRIPGGMKRIVSDAAEGKRPGAVARFDEGHPLAVSKADAVYRSGNQTRDDIPSHLIVGDDVPPGVATMYAHLCPAGVYELSGGRLAVNAPNCVDCKATDVLGPRWTPREGGSGPRYRRM